MSWLGVVDRCGGERWRSQFAFRRGGDVPEAPFVYMCQVCLVLRGHRMGVILRYRHPLGSLRPFVARFRLT